MDVNVGCVSYVISIAFHPAHQRKFPRKERLIPRDVAQAIAQIRPVK